ncbi:phosphodiesterase [Halovulum dunhuangense]|uniref:Phosphodiesterase n=1 Tax=Halovulum dunhuangense TaxID=1505036 RepID=A0A849L5I2_9RHOB|nr:glycerophosphodiester phosphodiesterase family protein [Halovulum dunhuangense]NNU81645.1 phosphodiesterase [Halovulum dunhuangense]
MTPHPDFLRLPIAHRGLHDRARGVIENSESAVRAAIAAGYGIEIDIQPSAEGVPMVFHDARLSRLTGAEGNITDLSAGELGRIALTGGTDRIPTLAHILDVVGGRVPLLVEIKDQDGTLGPDVGALEQAVAGVLAGYGGPVAVMSFNPHSVAAFGKAAPGIARGIVTESFDEAEYDTVPEARRLELSAIADFDRVGASFVSCNWRDLDRTPIHGLRARQVPILCWTIRSAAEEAEARRLADNITFEGYAAALAH